MTHLLDTNPCIRYLNGRSEILRQRIDSAGEGTLAICSVVKAELFFGALKSTVPEKTLSAQRRFLEQFPSLSFDDRAAEVYASIRNDLERRGLPIGANDLMIAAIAIANNLVLVSQNAGEFTRVSGLKLENWE